jgi:hypothetical protein
MQELPEYGIQMNAEKKDRAAFEIKVCVYVFVRVPFLFCLVPYKLLL